MAEICCGLVAGVEPAGMETAADICDITSRAARRRRIAIRRFKLDSGVDLPAAESGRKRKMMDVAAPIMDFPDLRKDLPICPVGEEAEVAADDSRSPAEEKVDDAFSNECPMYGVMSVCGRRRDMEDSISVHPDMLRHAGETDHRYHFFGVFDGHGCSHVAVSCMERMHEIVSEEMDQLSATPPAIPPTIPPAILPATPPAALEWKNLFERSFCRMDAEAASWRGGSEIPTCRCEFQTPKCDHVGSTAVVSVISKDHIAVANCGDSRAVLCRNGTPVPLSDDHKPDRPDELRRIEEAGGRVIYWDGARVLGVLAMSRAIGDNYLKPFVISEPDVTVTERGEGDECLILASDGLWDVVTNETACQIVRMVLRGSAPPDGSGSQKACADAATLLAKLALARHSADNVSVVVVDLRR